jgi:hypothetical protein
LKQQRAGCRRGACAGRRGARHGARVGLKQQRAGCRGACRRLVYAGRVCASCRGAREARCGARTQAAAEHARLAVELVQP